MTNRYVEVKHLLVEPLRVHSTATGQIKRALVGALLTLVMSGIEVPRVLDI